jgi:hypothetical protein
MINSSSAGNSSKSALQKELQEGLDELELKSINELFEEIDSTKGKIEKS